MSKFTKFLNLFIPGKTDKGSVVTDVFEPNFSKIDDSAESTDLELKRLEKDKLDKGLVSEEYDTAKKIEDKIKEAKKAGTDAGTEANKKLDKGNVQTKYDTAEKIGNEIDKKFDKGSLPAKISDAKDLYDLIQNNSGLNFDENLLFLNDAGTKYVNKIYFDRNKKGLFKCISQTTSTTNSTSYFVDISNEANSAQLRNLGTYIYYFISRTLSLIINPKNSIYKNFDILDDKYFIVKKAGLYKISFISYVTSQNGTRITVLKNDKEFCGSFYDISNGDGDSRTMVINSIINLKENDKLSFSLSSFSKEVIFKNLYLTVNFLY